MADHTPLTTVLNHIGGKDVPAASGATLRLIDPATGRVHGTAPLSGADDVDAAHRAAQDAFEGWSATTPVQRQTALLRIADAMERQADTLASAEVTDTGKPRALFLADELPAIVDVVRYFAGAARNLPGAAAMEYAPGRTSVLRREPVGVCAQITPWNYPLMMAVWKVAPALAAGNTVILKPSDTTPSSATLLARLAAEHLPPGALNVVCGDRDTGRHLVVHPGVRQVAVTGSVRAGQQIAVAAAADLKRLHLELGGNAPVVIHEDADLDEAVEQLSSLAFYNAGQDCTAATRILVHHRIHDAFLAAFAQRAGQQVSGDPDDPDTDFGPLNNAAQLASVRRLLASLPDHAEVVTGGAALVRPGFFHQATVVAGVGQEDEIVQSEVFGPVVTVQSFTHESEAFHLANSVPQGLAASVWTRDHDRAMRASRAMRAGIVWVNTHGTTVSEMPHGGVRHSGYGSDLSLTGLLDYTQVKHVML
ncbi:aminobutyraldehyde dehydrogenase [Streptomyces sp. NPDC051320]|uniref:aminobutyraldehyde dehydrogenase n=1 Tax=Streptomyces sp. NPDC051320 TaxID=3154644 RepID=UPI003429AF8B